MSLNFQLLDRLNITSQEKLDEIIEILKKAVANEEDESSTAQTLTQQQNQSPSRDLD
jgi:hypothetical protein